MPGFAVLALVLALALRLYMALVSVQLVPVTADESITVLQAKHIWKGDFPLLVLAQPYQFPVEAYFSAPLVNVVPRTPLGARYISFLEGLAGLALLLIIIRKLGGLKTYWPAAVLVLFPSAYWLMIQFGYSLPHNSPIYLASSLALVLLIPTQDASMRWWKRLLCYAVTGMLAPLAFANNMLALALMAPLIGVTLFWGGWKKIPINLAGLAAGAAVGIIPFWQAVMHHPGAHVAVSATRAWDKILAFIWEPTLLYVLPRSLGFAPPLFPDSNEVLPFGVTLMPYVAVVFVVILGVTTLYRIGAVLRTLWKERRLALEPVDVFLGISLAGLLIFATSNRSTGTSFRYLAPVVYSFPFVCAGLYAVSRRPVRIMIGTGCVALALWNVIATCKLVDAWRAPDFAVNVVDAPDQTAMIRFLKEKGIRYCVGAHWQIYRLNFYTDEQILASQPLNERFSGWPLPYSDQVHAQTNVAYVLSDRSNRDFTPEAFESNLKALEVSARKETLGHFTVYYDFRRNEPWVRGRKIDPALLSARASQNTEEATTLVDHIRQTRWTTKCLQTAGMWVEVDIKDRRSVSRLTLIYDRYFRDRAPLLNVYVRVDGKWVLARSRVEADLDAFEFENNHPVYGQLLQSLAVGPVLTDGIRLEIAEPDPAHSWTFTEIEVYERNP